MSTSDAPARGRGRPRVHASDAARKAAYRARKNVRQVNVQLSPELDDALEAYVQRQAMDGAGLTKSQVIAKLLSTQLLRKR